MKKYTPSLKINPEEFYCNHDGSIRLGVISLITLFTIVFSSLNSISQNPTTTFPAGAYIIDMGQTPQSKANGLKPYGLVYQLIITAVVPVNWAINSSKVKDGIDFTASTSAGTKNYKGGSFVISSDYITASVITLINTWKVKGVIVDGPTIGIFTAPVYKELTTWPIAVLDADNDGLISPYYANAEVPKASYKLNANPLMLSGCTGGDLYVLPHADPDDWDTAWITALQNYINNGGFLWAGCHAVSVLENIPGCNFLSTGGLIAGDDHSNSTANYLYTYNSSSAANPIMQFIGTLDGSTTNGSEQIYVPGAAGWRSTTTQAVYDANYINTKTHLAYTFPQAATIVAYGPAFGDITKGTVMYEAGHDLTKGTITEQVAAQRAYFNFVLMAGEQTQITISLAALPGNYEPGETYSLNATVSGGTLPYTYKWSCDNGGTFTDEFINPTNYTAPLTSIPVIIKLKVTDACGRVNFATLKWVGKFLPIELLSFYAEPENDFINISWSTASEINNDYFTIEKGIDAMNFEFVANVDGAGNSNALLNYSTSDNEPSSGVSYYRLKQTDFDGNFSYSNVIEVDFVGRLADNVTIYPNPFYESVNIRINDALQIYNYEFRIFNDLGEEVTSIILTESFTTLAAGELFAGSYLYTISGNGEMIQSGRLISE